ncbi:Pyrophosphate-energized proton pump [hydrothermal vent metagenome]|uniref:Pyrophosphate-energized proton pump n=1 Tax=hydrothermal vent metagenome TaxID=652676 RepID=A0A3B1DXB2_9ZZZZ
MNTTMPITLASLGDIPWPYFIAPIAAIAALIMARVFAASVMKKTEGDDEMVRIAQAVREGAMAYLTRQYRVVAMVFVVLVLFLAALVGLKLQPWQTLIGVPIAGLLSGLCGWFGMKMATNASARTTAAVKDSLNDGLTVAFRSGAVMGLNVVGFALLDISIWFGIFNAMDVHISQLTTIMLSFGMGASTQALFARVGGGIYTKAADVGADLVGKVEAGIPEDDARNPATIADNVGDNVGDVAGMGADLYESYYGSILATMALGAAAAFTIGKTGAESTTLALGLAAAPIALAGIGILCSILGVFTVKARDNAGFNELLKSLHKGVYVASGLIVLGAFGLLYMLFGNSPEGTLPFAWWGLGFSIVSGLAAGLVIAHATEYYTSYEHPPTRRIAEQALTGPATVIIAGIAEGMKSTWASLLTVVIAILAAFGFAGGGENFLMGLYGVGIAAVGMLSTLGITLATDAYGPIADNAGGNAEMTDQPAFVRERTDMLDSLGNTTAATGKGFAIGSAALTALALFAAYIQIVQIQITTQAETYAAKNAGVQDAPYVIYQGYHKFAVVDPTQTDEDGKPYVDGGMLVDRFQFEGLDVGFDEAIKKGQTLETVVPLASRGGVKGVDFNHARTFLVTHSFDHNGHTETMQFEIISTRNGRLQDILAFYDVTIANPRLLGGIFIGVLLAFLFCALTMNAVGRAAYEMMGECRRQFGKMREAFRANGMSEEQIADPMQWPKQVEFEGVTYPDYAECVSISTAGAQREMVIPSILAICIPIAVGLILSVPGVLGMLAGGLTSGFAVAVFMANAGGAWDNAKKLLESYGTITANDAINNEEQRNKIPETIRKSILAKAEEMIRTGHGDDAVYGKGSDDHKATVVGDTVGDPFKDTSGPSLNILIKLISIVSVVFAGLIVAYGPIISSLLGLT